MGVLRPIVERAPNLAVNAKTKVLQSRAVRAQAVGHDALGAPMLLHRLLEQFQCCISIPRLGDHVFEHFTLVTDGATQVMRHAVNLHKDFIEVSAPVFATAHSIHPLKPNFIGKHRTKPVPPAAQHVMANLKLTLMQEVLHIAKLQPETNVKYHGQTDDLWACLEGAEREAFCHPSKLPAHTAPRQPKLL
jgi:hypothetical protein